MLFATALFAVTAEHGEEAAHAAETSGGLGTVLPALPELVWGAVGFLILFVILKKFAFPQMNAMLEQRSAAIQGKLEEAERARAEAATAQTQHQAEIAAARAQDNQRVEQAKADAERVRADIIAKAEAEAAQIRAKATEDAAAERGRLVQDLRAQVAALSVEVAGKIVQRELSADQHRALVDSYIDQLSGMN
jgi:F-type H+-transporting ATPase subunit b